MREMTKLLSMLFVAALLVVSCSKDDEPMTNQVTAPTTYKFTREGNSTVDYNGQSTRIAMAEELVAGLMDNTKTEDLLDAMFAHQLGDNNFSDPNLNASDKNVKSKVAASIDYFSANTTTANVIKADFDSWIKGQVEEVFPYWNTLATVGNAGQLQEAGGGPIRYLNAKGLEYDQAFGKSLISALMVDQMLNHYLSTSVLDAGTNKADNDAGILEAGKNYTSMEHKWDEAFGYLYGAEIDAENPQLNTDGFLSKYLFRVNNDPDFLGIANTIYNAFKLGRAAIVAKDYSLRNQQANIIKEKISEIIGIRAVYYLQQAKAGLVADKASAFHDLSEGYGFIYGLQFTRKPNTDTPYFTKTEVDSYISTLMEGNGFWDVSAQTLDDISEAITARFKFTLNQAKD